MTTTKKISLVLVGKDGNAFALIGAFQRQARKEGWTNEEIKGVLQEAMTGDYDHLLRTLIDHCKDPFGEKEDEDDDDYFEDEEDEEEYN